MLLEEIFMFRKNSYFEFETYVLSRVKSILSLLGLNIQNVLLYHECSKKLPFLIMAGQKIHFFNHGWSKNTFF